MNSVVDIIEKINSDKIKEAIKNKKNAGYHVSYLVMSEETYAILRRSGEETKIINCGGSTWYFYGIPIAICNVVPAGEVEILVDEV
jgi:hypothetical protein